jgi:hypothetical protein
MELLALYNAIIALLVAIPGTVDATDTSRIFFFRICFLDAEGEGGSEGACSDLLRLGRHYT